MSDLKIKRITIGDLDMVGKILASDVLDPKTGEMLLRCNDELTLEGLERAREKRIRKFILFILMRTGPIHRSGYLTDGSSGNERRSDH